MQSFINNTVKKLLLFNLFATPTAGTRRTVCCARFHDSVHLEIARGPFRDREIAQPCRDWLVLLCQYNFISRTRTRFCSLFANKIDG